MLVSVVVPVYNSESYIAECIESILNQSYKNIELILINDGSTDNSLCILQSYKIKHSNIILLTQENKGVSAARNQGLRYATGNYICFIDSDDTLDSKFIPTLISEFDNPEIDFVYCSRKYNYNGKLINKFHRLKRGIYSIDGLCDKLVDDGSMSGFLFSSVCTAMLKFDLIKNNTLQFNENLHRNEDGLFMLQYCMNARNVSILSDKTLYINRRRTTSASTTYFCNKQKQMLRDAIVETYKIHGLIHEATLQLIARRASEAFWDILFLCSKQNKSSITMKIKNIKGVLQKDGLNESYRRLKITSNYKKICVFLMRKKMAFLLYLGIGFFYKYLKNKVQR